MKLHFIAFSTLCLVSLLSSSSFAETPIQVKPVHFTKETSSATMQGSIKGYQIIDYKLNARSGQSMEVSLKTNNNANYFNVLPPGSEIALFVGSTSGNQWKGTLPADGDYVVRVYLMRSAARRNEQAQYTLKVGVLGHSAQAPSTDAKVPGTNYHATGQIPCAMTSGQPSTFCNFGVTREGAGSAIVRVTKPGGGVRAIFFKNGKASAYDQSQADTGKFSVQKQNDLNIIYIGQERYEIPDAVIFGG